MKKTFPLLFAMAAASAFAYAIVLVAGTVSVSGNGLDVNFGETGLVAGATTNYTLTADATVTYGCFNHGGHNPSAGNKRTTVHRSVSSTDTVTADASGGAAGSITDPIPGSGSFACPPGQTIKLGTATFTNVSLTDTSNTFTISVPGTFRKVFNVLR